MKKALMTFVLIPLMAMADTETVDGIEWTYTIVEDEAQIGDEWGTAISFETVGSIVIPSVLGGKSVTIVGDYAFYGCIGLTSVTVPSSVKSIGDYAFADCSGLESVTISEGVLSIGGSAFSDCSGLTSITIPSSVTSIGDYAFADCGGLESVMIPDGVLSVGDSAFYDCSGLTSVAIPSSVTSIGYGAFEGCSELTSVAIPPCVTSLSSIFPTSYQTITNVEFVGEWTSIEDFAFGLCNGLESVIIPEGVLSIGESAFSDCSGLMSVTIPSSVTSIGDYAFANCGGLESVTIPQCVVRVGEGAFSGCSGLTSVAIPASVTSIGCGAFEGCSKLTSVTIPPCVTSLSSMFPTSYQTITNVEFVGEWTSIEDYAFQWCCGLESMTIPSSVTYIGDFAFDYCSGLESVTISEGVLVIGDYAFSGCGELTSVAIPSSVTSIGYGAFQACIGLESVTISEDVLSIGDYAFSGCGGLTSVAIPPSVTSVGVGAFEGCCGLTSVAIPPCVTSLSATFSCQTITNVEFVGEWTSIEDCAFQTCDGLESVIIPEGVLRIGDMAFSGCSGLASVAIPSSVASIGDYAFEGCIGLKSFLVDANNPVYSSCQGLLCSKDGKSLILGVNGEVIIPDCVTSIDDSAFYGCSGLTSVAIPSSVTKIGDYAFQMCGGLESVTIPEGVLSIGVGAFYGCSGLTSVTIPSSVASIGNSAFSGCSGLTAVTIPECVKQLSSTFSDSVFAIAEVNFQEGVRCIGAEVFKNCRGIRTVVISSSVASIESGAFSDCCQLESFTVLSDNQNYTSIDGLLCSKDGKLLIRGVNGGVVIPSCVTSICDYAFYGSAGLTSVTIPEGVTDIGDYAFLGCDGLETASIPASVTNIGRGAFSGCNHLMSLSVSEENPKYALIDGLFCSKDGSTLIKGCNGDVVIPSCVTSIEADAFNGCGGLTSVMISSSVTNIGAGAFAGCGAIKSVKVPACVTRLSSTFPDSYRTISEVVIAEGVTSVGREVLQDCGEVLSISIPSSVTNVVCARLPGPVIVSKPSGEIDERCLLDVTFPECKKVKTFMVAADNQNYAAIDGLLCSRDGTSLIKGVNGEVVIPSCVTRFCDYAFYDYDGLTSVAIPDGVADLGECTFRDCGGLTSVTIPASVNSVSTAAFLRCIGLVSLTISEGVSSIGDYAFNGCTKLESVVVPSSVETIGNHAFDECPVRSVTIPGWVRLSSVFSNSYGITNVVVAEGATAITDMAFYSREQLVSVSIPSSVRQIGRNSFFGCHSLKEIHAFGLDTDVLADILSQLRSNYNNITVYVSPSDVTALRSAYAEELPNVSFEIEGVDLKGVSLHMNEIIGQSVVWSNDCLHLVVGECRVESGGRLEIQSGSVVRIDPKAYLHAEADGKVAAEDVIFTTCDDVESDVRGAYERVEQWMSLRPFVSWEGDYLVAENCRGVLHGISCGRLTTNETWKSGEVHVVGGVLSVPAGIQLTIERGSVVKFLTNAKFEILPDGACVARGAIFTHFNDDTAGGDTNGDGNLTRPVLGAYSMTGEIYDDEDTEYRYRGLLSLPGDFVSGENRLSCGIYLVDSIVTIPHGASVCIPAGTIVKFTPNGRFVVHGSLVVEGTRLSPVVFTSWRDDEHGGVTGLEEGDGLPMPGDWGGIFVEGGTIDAKYAQFLYGGGPAANNPTAAQACLFMWTGSRGSFSGCRFSGSPMDGCFAYNATLSNCIFDDCDRGLVSVGVNVNAVNCLAIDNRIGFFSHTSPLRVVNSISAFNVGAGFDYDGGRLEVDHCCAYNPGGEFGKVHFETACIRADPKFVGSEMGDYSISADSPCVDAANGTQATEKDYFGRSRQDGLVRAPTGTPMASGRYPDIGICEYLAPRVVSSVDLQAVSIAAAENQVSIGSKLSVHWTVSNVGEDAVDGERRDVIELVDAAGAVWPLGEVVVPKGLVPGGVRTEESRFTLPAVAVGASRLRLRVNAYRDVFEGAEYANNVVEDVAVLTVDVPECLVGLSTVELDASLSRRILPGSGVTAIIVRGADDIDVFGGAGYVPVGQKYDVEGVRLADGALLLSIPGGCADDFVFTLVNNGQRKTSLTIETVSDVRSILGVEPKVLATASIGEFCVRGIGLSRVAGARLIGGSSSVVGQIRECRDAEVVVGFDGTGLEPGVYELEVSDVEGGVIRFPSAVAVYRPNVGPKPEYRLNIPSAVREGRIYTGRIEYSNKGDTPCLAPCFLLSASDAEVRFNDDEDWATGDFEIMGISSQDPAGLLGPQVSGELTFEFRAGRNSKLTLSVDDDDSEEWLMHKQSLSDAATIVNRRGRKVFGIGDLEHYAELFAAGGNVAAVCGTLTDKSDGSPMTGGEVVAMSASGEILSSDVVDKNGCFVLECLPAGTNLTLAVVANGFADNLIVTVPETGDLRGVRWMGERGFALNVVALGAENADFEKGVEVVVTSLDDILSSQMLTITNAVGVRASVRDSGAYLVTGRMRGGWEVSAVADCRPGQSLYPITLDFTVGNSVSGRVIDEAGRPVTNATVFLAPKDGLMDFPASAQVDADGAFSFGCVADADYVLSALASGYGLDDQVRLSVAGEDVSGCDLRMIAYTNVIQGLVQDASAGLRVSFVMENVEASSQGAVASDGSFTLAGLPAGTGTFMLIDPTGGVRCVLSPLVVKAGVNRLQVSACVDACCVMGCAYDKSGSEIEAIWTFVPVDGNAMFSVSAAGTNPVVSLRKTLYDVTVVASGYVSRSFRQAISEPCRLMVPLEKGGSMLVGHEDDDEAIMTYLANGRLCDGTNVAEGFLTGILPSNSTVRAFVASTNAAYFTKVGVVQAGVTGVLERVISSRPLTINIVGEAKLVSSVAILRLVPSEDVHFSAVFPVSNGKVVLTEFPAGAVNVEALALDGSVLGRSVLDASENVASILLGNTVAVSGRVVFEGGGFVGGSVVFVAEDGNHLASCALTAGGAFRSENVAEVWSSLWVELLNGMVFCVPRTEAEASDFMLTVPSLDDCKLTRTKVVDEAGHAVPGARIVYNVTGYSYVREADHAGIVETIVVGDAPPIQSEPLPPNDNSGAPVVDDPAMHESEVQPIPVCPSCGGYPCHCPVDEGDPDGTTPDMADVCPSCGRLPCTCLLPKEEPLDEPENDAGPIVEEPADQLELEPLRLPDLPFEGLSSNWDLWWAWYKIYAERIGENTHKAYFLSKPPNPRYAACEKRNCTLNERIFERFRKYKGRAIIACDAANVYLEEVDRDSYDAVSKILQDLIIALASWSKAPGVSLLSGALDAARSYQESNSMSGFVNMAVDESLEKMWRRYLDEKALQSYWDGVSRQYSKYGKSVRQLRKLYSKAMSEASILTDKSIGNFVKALTSLEAGKRIYEKFNLMNSKVAWLRNLTVTAERLTCLAELASKEPYHCCGGGGGSGGSWPNRRIVDESKPDTPQSLDPNEVIGPAGKGTSRLLKPGETVSFTVYFENAATATASAADILVSSDLPEYLDWSTFEMKDVVFANQLEPGLRGCQSGSSEISQNGSSYFVRTIVDFNCTTGHLKFELHIADKTTKYGVPDDPYAGVLPPNDESHRGEGYFTYSIKVREDAPAGVRFENSALIIFDNNAPIATDPVWWNNMGRMVFVEGSSGGTASVMVDPNWIKANVGESASDAQVAEALNKTGKNGIKVWANAALGLDPTDENDKFLIDAPQNDDSDKVTVKTLKGALPESAWTPIKYRVDVDQDGSGTATPGTAQDANEFGIDIGGETDPTGIYKVLAVFTDDEGAEIEEVPAANQIGVLRKTAANKREIVPVPWTKFAAGAEDIAISNLVKTAGLMAGDKLYVYDDSAKRYATWELQSDKTWKPVKTVKMVNGKLEALTADSPEVATVKRGSGVWIERHDITKPIHFVGQHDAAPVEVPVEAGTTATPKWTLVASPLLMDWDLNSVSEGVNVADRIIVPTGKEPRIYTRDATNAKWGYITYEANAKGIVKPVRKEDDTMLKAGTGFWYVSEGGAPTLRWREASEE